MRQSNAACEAGDFANAVILYTEALSLDPTNHVLYSNRSAARIKQGHFSLALQDACKARDLCPTWAKGCYRQGKSQSIVYVTCIVKQKTLIK